MGVAHVHTKGGAWPVYLDEGGIGERDEVNFWSSSSLTKYVKGTAGCVSRV